MEDKNRIALKNYKHSKEFFSIFFSKSHGWFRICTCKAILRCLRSSGVIADGDVNDSPMVNKRGDI